MYLVRKSSKSSGDGVEGRFWFHVNTNLSCINCIFTPTIPPLRVIEYHITFKILFTLKKSYNFIFKKCLQIIFNNFISFNNSDKKDSSNFLFFFNKAIPYVHLHRQSKNLISFRFEYMVNGQFRWQGDSQC